MISEPGDATTMLFTCCSIRFFLASFTNLSFVFKRHSLRIINVVRLQTMSFWSIFKKQCGQYFYLKYVLWKCFLKIILKQSFIKNFVNLFQIILFNTSNFYLKLFISKMFFESIFKNTLNRVIKPSFNACRRILGQNSQFDK